MIIFDILVAAVFLGFTFIGYKRGFFLSIMRIVVVVAALLIAIWASKPLSEWTYDTFIEASIKDSISTKMDEAKGTMSEKLNKTIEGLPKIIQNAMVNAGVKDGWDAMEKIGLSDSAQETDVVDGVADKVVRPLTVSLISSIYMIVLFVVLLVLLTCLVNLLNKTMKLPVLKELNGILGLVIGAIEGLLLAWVISMMLFSFAKQMPKNGFITYDSLKETKIVRLLGDSKSANPANLLDELKDSTNTQA